MGYYRLLASTARVPRPEVRRKKVDAPYVAPQKDNLVEFGSEKAKNRYKAVFEFYCNLDRDLYEQAAELGAAETGWWENTSNFETQVHHAVRGYVLHAREHAAIARAAAKLGLGGP